MPKPLLTSARPKTTTRRETERGSTGILVLVAAVAAGAACTALITLITLIVGPLTVGGVLAVVGVITAAVFATIFASRAAHPSR